MRPSFRSLIVPVAFALAISAPSFAAQNRISKNFQTDPASRVALRNSVHPRVSLAQDLGPAAENQRLESLTLRFSPTPAQQAALDQLLLDQQNPSSPRFHQWLTPEQYATQFGLSPADLASVSSWLTSQGLNVTGTARSATFITFSGTVGQVQGAFATSIHTLLLGGEAHIANLTDPTIPSALAAVVTGITGLNDFKLKPRARVRSVKADLKPDFTSSISGNHYIAPGDLYTIYDESSLLSSSINGAGVTIAVMGQTDLSLADAAAFRSASGLAANPPTVKLYGNDPGTSSADIDEAQLDVEWSGAVAPNATILYVNSGDIIGTSLTQAIDNNVAPIVTLSYGDCEANWGTGNLNIYNQLFKQANAQGTTIVGPGGDSGATDCDYATTSPVTSATHGLAVDFPASSPYVTGAGGTMFNEGSATYFNSTNNANSGSAISYIPEAVWNESNLGGGLAAGGGGASAFFTKPAWQTGTGVPSDFSRDVPDIALDAAANHDGYLFCSQGSCVNGYRTSSGYLNVVGGTSIATPSMAGILALVEQKIGSRIGNANPTLYALANSTYYNNVFHDVTTGNNNSPCTAGTLNCFGVNSIGYSAAVGYDLASGWGSLDVFNLVNDWSLVTPAGIGSTVGTVISNTALTSPTASVTAGGSITLTAAVSSGSSGTTATPTGSVQFLLDNVAAGPQQPLSGGSVTYKLATLATLTSGPHTVTAAYSGDSTYAGSKAALQIDVLCAICADFSLTPAATSTSAAAGASTAGIPFTVTSANGFSGAVTFSASVNSNSLPNDTSISFSVNPVTVTSTAAGSTVLTINGYISNAHTVLGLSRHASLNRPAATRTGTHPLGTRAPWLAGSSATLAGIFLLALPHRRRWSALLAFVLSVAAICAVGCSSSSPVPNGGGKINAAAGTYTVTVTASSGSISHNATVTLTIQ